MVDDPRHGAERVLPGRPPAWQPWAALSLFAFLLNFLWELLQVPFYRGMAEAPHWAATLFCLRATGGDVLITLAAYGAVALRSGSSWIARPSPARVIAFLAAGLLITIVIELVSVHLLERWAYADGAPVVFGVGLPPLIQWVVLPPAGLWLTRRHLGLVIGPRPGGQHRLRLP